MKKPKSLKFPKSPKLGASVEVWERYHKRCADVKKRNEDRLRPYKVRLSKVSAIKTQVSKLKGKS
jgi:hypothetical protein